MVHMSRVFLCDDESHYRSLVRAVLTASDEPFEVVGEAGDGQEAIDLAPALQPDLLLLDVNMPGMGGLEALPRLRELLPDTRIVALTTAWADPYEQRFLELGGDGFIEKPRNAMTLPVKLRDVLGQPPVEPMDVAELMFHAWSDGSDRRWDVFDPDVVYTSVLTGETTRGIEAFRAYVTGLPAEQRRVAKPTRMATYEDVVVVDGVADITQGEEHQRFPVSWTIRVRDGKIVELHGFRDWDDARRHAGGDLAAPPTQEREFSRGHGWLLAATRSVFGGPSLRHA
jgi:DNA-binding NarL/FixJ family response regulator